MTAALVPVHDAQFCIGTIKEDYLGLIAGPE